MVIAENFFSINHIKYHPSSWHLYDILTVRSRRITEKCQKNLTSQAIGLTGVVLANSSINQSINKQQQQQQQQ
jgi:hypothetical protein